MPKILTIDFVEPRYDKDGNKYYRTHATLQDGDEVVGFSRKRTHFQEGDAVMRFFHKGVAKMAKKE